MKTVENEVKNVSFFDPQFYVPSSERKNILTYPFYPNTIIHGEYGTAVYQECAYESAEGCIKFQIEQNYDRIIIPSFYDSNDMLLAIQKTNETIINNHLAVLKEKSITTPVYLTAIVTDSILVNEKTTDYYLNILTKYQEVDGIYLIPNLSRTNKRISNINNITALMNFIYTLRKNDLDVQIGYTDIDSILYTLADPSGVTMGTYENSRHFSINKFLEPKRSGPPKARLFSAPLLQWIDADYIEAIHQLYPDADTVFDHNKYYQPDFRHEFDWQFQNKEIYFHYFLSFKKIVDSLPLEFDDRLDYLRGLIANADSLYKKLANHGIIFDANSSGDHLSHWLTAINLFEKKIKG